MRGVFLDYDTMAPQDLDFSALAATLTGWRTYGRTAPQEVLTRIESAAVVMVNKVVLDRSVLENAADLKLVCIAATGTNNVDLGAAEQLGIPVCNVRGYGTDSVAQHVFALVLTLARRLPDYDVAVREGRWQRHDQFCLLDYPIRELTGRCLGIVGHGTLGQAVGRLASAFGMQVMVAHRPGGTENTPGRVPLRELLAQVDVLSLHCPLTPDTQGLIGADELALMKPDALLINTARGGVVDERALADALRAGRLGGAGVDVLSVEPPAAGNPLLSGDIPNLVVTPHVAWASREARQRIVNELAENVRAFVAGRARNLVRSV